MKYDVSWVLGARDRDRVDVVRRRDRVARVDEPGVGLAGDDLVEGGPDVLLEAGRFGVDAGSVEHREGDPAARDVVGAAHPGGAVEVLEGR